MMMYLMGGAAMAALVFVSLSSVKIVILVSLLTFVFPICQYRILHCVVLWIPFF